MVTARRRSSSKARLKKAQLSFYPEPEDYAALKALSARTGVAQQVYLREGLKMILHRRELFILRADTERLHRQARQELDRYPSMARKFAKLERRLRRGR